MTATLDQQALEQVFLKARTHSHWQDKAVSDKTLKELYDLVKMAPTAANSSPARFVFVTSSEGKEKLKPCLSPGNVEKTMAAPVTVIVAYDLEFYERLPELFPHADARSWYVGNDKAIEAAAMLNGSLQGGYLIVAARMLGLDCGPMSGFDAAKTDEAFLAASGYRSNFLINLGYGDREQLHGRSPRLSFEEACEIV